MKISIALSFLILAAAAGLGWHDHQRLTVVRASHTKLVAEASQLGISLDLKNPAGPVRVTKHERENREADARLAAVEFIAFAKEMEAMEKKGGQPDEATQKKILDFMDRMMGLDSAQLKILIAEIRTNKELKDETRNNLIGFSIMTLANDHPKAALALFTESSDLFKDKDSGMGRHLISSSLAKWAKDDPNGALEWVKTNADKFPDLITDDSKRGLISGTAATDPALAFKLIGELGLKDTPQAISSIMSAAKTPEERTATFAAYRTHLATLTDEKSRSALATTVVSLLGSNLGRDGFQSATAWIEKASLTPEELEGVAGSLNHSVKSAETGQWIEWMGGKLPPEKANANIRNLVTNWTRNDYQAAGKWLASAQEGPAKISSVRAYAETVSKYEPEAAAQWAMTLPPGKDREDTLKRIHNNWPENDPAAKEAFAKEHGIE